jgi:hypothetical protein
VALSATLVCASAQATPTLQTGFAQQGPKLVASGEEKSNTPGIAGGQFGHSVALSDDGKTAIVGGNNDRNGYGSAWVFLRSGSSWKQDGHMLAPSGNVGEAHFGDSVALSADGKTALIGGSQFGGGLGAVWVFARSGSGWAQQARIVGPGSVGAQAFGVSVALSGDGNTAIVGASFYNNRIGAAFLYHRSGSTWKRLGNILIGVGGDGTPGYGSAVALSKDGKTAAVGGPIDGGGTSRLGSVWTYSVSSSGWTPLGKKIVARDAVQDGSFGQSVSLSSNGKILAVGASTGGAWLFDRSGSSWNQSARLGAPTAQGSLFGNSVGLSGSGKTVVVGAPYDGAGATQGSGSAWAFTGSGSHWGAATKLGAKGASGLAELGWAVAVSGDGKTAIAGGPADANAAGAAWVSAA